MSDTQGGAPPDRARRTRPRRIRSPTRRRRTACRRRARPRRVTTRTASSRTPATPRTCTASRAGRPDSAERDPNARPGTVLAAGIVAIVMSGSVFLVGLLSVIVGSALVALDEDLGLDREIALNALWMVCGARRRS